MNTGGSSTGSSRSQGQRRSEAGGYIGPHDHDLIPESSWPADDQPTVISPKSGSSGPMPILTGLEWAEALVGQTLGHYELQGILGTGGMGAVFRGHDTALNKIVAVKVLLPSSGDDEDLLRRFKNEAQSAARLDHVHAARVYYVGEERGLHYIVYEYIEGRNIRDLVIDVGPLPVEDAVRYTYQIADTLSHAATRDVVHRDIKPSNILVTTDGIAKLVDMGLARLHQVEHTGGDLTASGVTLGTFDFISPEQARDPRTADTRSDIYSLGCTLYFMLTGQPPFPSGTVLQKLLQHEGDAPPDVRQLRADAPDELAGIVRTMLAKKPEQRYQTPAALMNDLAGFASRAGLRPLGAPSAVVAVPQQRREVIAREHIPWIVAIAVFIVVVLSLDYVWSPGDTSSLLAPLPDAPVVDSAPVDSGSKLPAVDDSSQTSQSDAFKPAANDTANSRPAADSSDPAAERTPAEASAAGILANAPHPLRSEWGSAARDSARAAGPRDAVTSNDDASLSVSSSPRAGRERIGPESAPNTSTSPVEPAAGVPLVDSAGVITVAVSASPDNRASFATLERAYEAALSYAEAAAEEDFVNPLPGDVRPGDAAIRIELRFNGPLVCQPLRIETANVDLVAAAGFSPSLVFRPSGTDVGGPSSMFAVIEGELTIDGVAIDLTMPDEPAPRPNFFEAQDADLIRLRDCSLTIRPASGAASATTSRSTNAFFEIAPSRAAGMRMTPDMPEMNGAMPLVSIRLDRCVVRGDATLMHVGGARNARLSWSNGLAVLGRPLLAVEGARQSLPGAHVKAMLTHVTAGLRGGLVSITNAQTTPFLPVVEIESYDSIFAGGDQPLVASQGVDSIEDFRDRFRWKGERNFYDNWTRLWRIHGVGFESEPEELSFRDWVTHWGRSESAPSLGPVIWRNPISLARPPHNQQLADFALADTDANPARGSGEKGTDAGASFEQLPTLPWPGQFAE